MLIEGTWHLLSWPAMGLMGLCPRGYMRIPSALTQSSEHPSSLATPLGGAQEPGIMDFNLKRGAEEPKNSSCKSGYKNHEIRS